MIGIKRVLGAPASLMLLLAACGTVSAPEAGAEEAPTTVDIHLGCATEMDCNENEYCSVVESGDTTCLPRPSGMASRAARSGPAGQPPPPTGLLEGLARSNSMASAGAR